MKARRLRDAVANKQLMSLMGPAQEWMESGDVFDEAVGEFVADAIDDLIRHSDAPPGAILQETRAIGRGLQARIGDLFKEAGLKPPR